MIYHVVSQVIHKRSQGQPGPSDVSAKLVNHLASMIAAGAILRLAPDAGNLQTFSSRLVNLKRWQNWEGDWFGIEISAQHGSFRKWQPYQTWGEYDG